MKTLTKLNHYIYYLVLMFLTQQTQCNQSAYAYKANLPFSYNIPTGLNNVPVHPFYHQQQQSQIFPQQQQQQSYLSLPFMSSYGGNLRKKPTTTSTFIYNKNMKHKHHTNNNHHNNNMHMYSKRYKRYPPFQAMHEIPIKKGIARYLPYAPMYPMGVMSPSILLPLYVPPAKATTRIILKPSVLDLASTSAAKIKQTKVNNKSLLLNYLRMANDKKNNYVTNTTLSPLMTTTTTTTKMSNASTTIGSYAVDGHIKFYDTPYSATNLHQQQQKQYYKQFYNHDFPTHFLLPMMPATTTTAATLSTTRTIITEDNFKRMPSSFYERGQIVNDKGDYEFLPTWYSYGKQQPKKYSNFFTIEDAITPYKPIEPLTIGYQPSFNHFENTQTESFAHIKPTSQYNMEFSPLHATETTPTAENSLKAPTTTATTTTSSFLQELSREASKWNLFTDEKDDTATTTTKQLTNTVGALKVEEISLTSSAPITTTTTKNMSKLERALKMAENVEPHRIRLSTTAATNISRKSIKKVLRTKSFFDDWFADENIDESMESTAAVDKVLTTTSLLEIDNNKLHKLKWPSKRRHQNMTRSTTTTTTTTEQTTINRTTGVLKKPHKKYGNAKPHKINRNFTSKGNIELKTNDTKKFVKRIKKVLRVRPTLFSILKLQNKNIDEQIDRPLQAMDMTPTQIIQNSMEDNEQVTFAPKILTTTLQTLPFSTTTTTTTSSTTGKSSVDNVEKTPFGGNQRKRGRHSYNNNNNSHRNENRSTTEATNIRGERQERIQTNKKSRQTQARQRPSTTSTTTTTSSTTIEPKNHRYELEILPIKNHKVDSSTTMESAIMKISRNKRINNILENLLITSSTTSTPISDSLTEYPKLPIEVYFQKIKTGFK